MRPGAIKKVTVAAYELHQSVPADRWCVSYLDLTFLHQEVKTALGCGGIQPEPDDAEAYGPSIYTVTEQYIKPVTWQAGKMSWALMRNPDGLECDLFISHAWQEGIFEFLGKVRHSWPSGVKTAWCCMLANPQNLEISSFLQPPRASPFAIALRSADVMLVVPNRHQSVYTRLWCAYEAYLAQEEGKTILIAHPSNLHQVQRALRWMPLAAALGATIGISATFLEMGVSYALPTLTFFVIGLSLVTNNNLFRRVMHLVGVVLCWIQATHHCGASLNDKGFCIFLFKKDPKVPHAVNSVVHMSYFLMTSAVFCVMEVDRINSISAVSEAEELRQGYQGSIQYAKCSQKADSESILGEIGDQVHRVDHAIHVLLTAGMSTPALRDIAHSVNIKHAAFSEITGAVLLLGPFAMIATSMTFLGLLYGEDVRFRVILALVSVLSRLVLFVLLWRNAWDEQRFILKVMNKFLFVATIDWMLLVVSFFTIHLGEISAANTWLFIIDFCLLSMLSFALLGIRGTAKLPFGLRALQFFFSRGSTAWTALNVRCCKSLESSDGTDSETETLDLSE